MVDCEMCGKIISKPEKAIVEGIAMNLCPQCASYGKRLEEPKNRNTNINIKKTPRIFQDPDSNKFIIANYGAIVKSAREKKGLKQEQVAKSLNEKESVIHKVESGHLEPSLKLAKKLERFFGIKITENL